MEKNELQKMNETELPKGWVWTTMGEIAEINPKLPFDSLKNNLEVSFLPMNAVEKETGLYDSSIIRQYAQVKKGYTNFIAKISS